MKKIGIVKVICLLVIAFAFIVNQVFPILASVLIFYAISLIIIDNNDSKGVS